MAKIPKFKTLEEAAAFWDTNDFEDHVADTEPVTLRVTIPRRKRTLTVPLDLAVYQQIQELAARHRVPVEQMVSTWLTERARAESAGR
jgi:hypothetical protein